MKYRAYNLAVLLVGGILLWASVFTSFWKCPWRLATGINCPACGMSSAFRAMLAGEYLKAFQYNPFAYPAAVAAGVAALLLLWGAIKNYDLSAPLFRFLGIHYKIALIGLIIMFFINNYR